MTFEQRTLIELSDILGIEYICNHCQSRFLVTIDSFDSAISKCPNCRHVIVSEDYSKVPDRPNDTHALFTLVKSLKDVRARGIGVRLALSPLVLGHASGGKG